MVYPIATYQLYNTLHNYTSHFTHRGSHSKGNPMNTNNNEQVEKCITIHDAITMCDDRGFDIQVYDGYAEPGYDNGKPVVLADWNDRKIYNREDNTFTTTDDTPSRMCKVFEWLGCDIDWSDEYVSCESCYRLLRNTADCHGWQFAGIEIECAYICFECIKEDDSYDEEILEKYVGNPNKAMTDILWRDTDLLERNNYHMVDEDRDDLQFASGLYGGQCDTPQKVSEVLEKHGITKYIFVITDVGQFDLHFSVMIEDSTDTLSILQRAYKILSGADTAGDVDPAEMMKQGLQNCKMDHTHKEGVTVNTVNLDDGSVDTKHYTADEFVKGIDRK